MTERARNLQLWLNDHGANLVVDGEAGPATRNAIIETFRNTNAPAATFDEINKVAYRLGASPRQLRAFAKVESSGGGWDDTGLLKCLWERHYLWRRIKLALPLISDPKPGGYTIDDDHDGICDSWEKLADAACRFGFSIAAECASFGRFQIMGAHWKALGYIGVGDFVWRLSRDELAHYVAFARYIEVNGLKPALRAVSSDPAACKAIALAYNGKRALEAGYHMKIARAFAEDKG